MKRSTLSKLFFLTLFKADNADGRNAISSRRDQSGVLERGGRLNVDPGRQTVLITADVVEVPAAGKRNLKNGGKWLE